MSARELHSTIAALLHLFHPGPSHPPTASEWALGIPLEIGRDHRSLGDLAGVERQLTDELREVARLRGAECSIEVNLSSLSEGHLLVSWAITSKRALDPDLVLATLPWTYSILSESGPVTAMFGIPSELYSPLVRGEPR